VKQITVKEYISLSDDKKLPYVALLTSVKAKDWFKVDINNLTYNQVRNLFKKLSKSESEEDIKEIFILAFGIDEEKLYSLPIQKYFQLKKYISDYFVFLQDKEQKLLQSVSADAGIWEAAGGNQLNEFSDVLPLSQLAKIYGGYPFDFGENKYVEIIYLLRMNNLQNQIEAEFQKLKTKM
jgi:hypothetical protein